jgi:hypothetical protein
MISVPNILANAAYKISIAWGLALARGEMSALWIESCWFESGCPSKELDQWFGFGHWRQLF